MLAMEEAQTESRSRDSTPPPVQTVISFPLSDGFVEVPVSLEDMVSGDVKTIKERMKRQGYDETMTRLKDEVRALMDSYGGPRGLCGSTSKTNLNARVSAAVNSGEELSPACQKAIARVERLQNMLSAYLQTHRGALRDSNANYLEVLIAVRYSLKVLYLQKNSKRTISDLLEILMGERCLHCCAPMGDDRHCRACMCVLCRIFDEDLVVDRFRNKTKTGRWLQCPSLHCGTYVHTDGAIDRGLVKLGSQCKRPGGKHSQGQQRDESTPQAQASVAQEGKRDGDGGASGKECEDEVVFECPQCGTQMEMWPIVKDVLTLSAGVKKKDMGKLTEEMDRAIRIVQMSPSAR